MNLNESRIFAETPPKDLVMVHKQPFPKENTQRIRVECLYPQYMIRVRAKVQGVNIAKNEPFGREHSLTF